MLSRWRGTDPEQPTGDLGSCLHCSPVDWAISWVIILSTNQKCHNAVEKKLLARFCVLINLRGLSRQWGCWKHSYSHNTWAASAGPVQDSAGVNTQGEGPWLNSISSSGNQRVQRTCSVFWGCWWPWQELESPWSIFCSMVFGYFWLLYSVFNI